MQLFTDDDRVSWRNDNLYYNNINDNDNDDDN